MMGIWTFLSMRTFEEIRNVEQTESDHNQPEQRSSDEEDSAGKNMYSVSKYMYRYKMQRLAMSLKIQLFAVYISLACTLYQLI